MTIRTVAFALVPACATQAQTSRLYMQDAQPYGIHNTEVRIAQGGKIIDTFELKTPQEHNLAIAGDIRTYSGVYAKTDGHRYDLDGKFLGQSYPFNPDPASYYGGDATTDGKKFNWIYDYGYGGVYRYTRNWKNPTLMFSVNNSNAGGITYDPADNTLWVLETWNAVIRHVKLNGDEISKFTDNALVDYYVALALDPADGTLWTIQGWNKGDGWRQYDRHGKLVGNGHFGSSTLTGSAEFDLAPACYPDFTADGTLDLFDFLAYVNAFNQSDPGAECDNDPGLTLFDFLCFVNAFNAGC